MILIIYANNIDNILNSIENDSDSDIEDEEEEDKEKPPYPWEPDEVVELDGSPFSPSG